MDLEQRDDHEHPLENEVVERAAVEGRGWVELLLLRPELLPLLLQVLLESLVLFEPLLRLLQELRVNLADGSPVVRRYYGLYDNLRVAKTPPFEFDCLGHPGQYGSGSGH